MIDNRNPQAVNEEPEKVVESPTTETEKEVEAPAVEETKVEETKETKTEVVEETTEKTEEEEPQKNTQNEEEQEVEEQPAKTQPTRAEKRIREVVTNNKNLSQENEILRERIRKFTQQPAPELHDGEMSYDDLNKLVNERALQAAALLRAGEQVESEYKAQVNKWAEDLAQVKKETPALDPESPDYDRELDVTLARLMDDGSGNGTPRTDILVSDVLKTIMKRESKAGSKAKEEGKSEATAKLAKQMAESAITPSSKTSKSEEYTEEEIAKIQTENPRMYTELVKQGKI